MSRLVTAATVQVLMAWLKRVAPFVNMSLMVVSSVTPPVFEPLMSWLKAAASRNIQVVAVTR